jgi:flagellar hook-basal body complex protein FliE
MRVEAVAQLPIIGSESKLNKPLNSSETFGQIFSRAIGDVNNLQQQAGQASIDLAAGKIQDVSEVVIASEKAAIALQLTMQVRNKVIDAYQEIMRMQV